jgi:hypothetical protein
MTAVSFMLIVDGCPFTFGSASCIYTDFSQTFSTDSGYPSNRLSDGWPEISQGTLRTGWTWTESCEDVLEGELQVSSMTFVLDDRPLTVDGAVRTRGITYLGTRKATRGTTAIPNSQLSASITSGALAFDVDAPSVFAGTGFLYIDREAILVDSLAGSTFTVDPNGRGAFNSVAASHTRDDSIGYAARVWQGFPGFDGRRVSLWQIAKDGTATRKWTGYCSSAERMGTGYSLTCEHAIVTERSLPLGIPSATPRLRGYNTSKIQASVSWPGAPTTGVHTARLVPDPPEGRVVNSPEEIVDWLQSNMRTQLINAMVTAPYVAASRESGGLRLFVSINTGADVTGHLAILDDEVSITSVETGDPRTVSLLNRPLPPVIVAVPTGPDAQTPVDTVQNLPSTWTAAAHDDGGFTTTVKPILRGRLDDQTFVILEPTSSTSGTAGSATTNGGPFITGLARTESADGTGQAYGLRLTEPVQLQAQVRIDSPHWLLAMRRGCIEDTTFVQSGADSRDWDFDSTQGAVLRATQDTHSQASIYLDGLTTLDSTFRDRFKVTACAIGIRAGKLNPFAFRPPLPTDSSVLTITKEMFADGAKPVWKRLRNALCNIVEVDNGRGLKIVVRDQQSAERYGASRTVSVKIDTGIRLGAESSPYTYVAQVLSRLIGVFGNPVSTVAVTLGPSQADAASIGDFVTISDWLSPDGNGAVGLNSTIGQVIAKTITNLGGTGKSSVTLTMLLYGMDGIVGIAPAIRGASLANVNVTRDTVIAATGYLGAPRGAGGSGPTDYAASNLSLYRYYATFPNDGGVSWIAAGARLRLVERNATIPHAPESVTVLTATPSSTPGASKLTFTAGVSIDWVAIAAAGNLDIVPDVYSVSTAAQRLFCYVATQTAPNHIGGTTDAAQVFAP